MNEKDNEINYDKTIEIAKSEYEATYEKARNIDTRVNLLLSISLAIITILLSLSDYSILTKFLNADLQMIGLLIIYLVSFLLTITIFIILLVMMIKILKLRDYAVFDINMFDTKFFVGIKNLDQVCLAKVLIEEYKNCTNVNRQSNLKKQKLYSLVIKLLPYALISTILCYFIKFFI